MKFQRRINKELGMNTSDFHFMWNKRFCILSFMWSTNKGDWLRTMVLTRHENNTTKGISFGFLKAGIMLVWTK